MPLYVFERVDDPAVTTDLLYSMNTAPSIGKVVVVDKIQWRRVAVKPQASFDTKADPRSVDDFLKVTNKRQSVGDMLDRSKEMAIKRREKEGVDTVQQGYFKDYSRRRRGTVHPEQKRQESAKKLAAKGIKVDYGTDD